MAEGVFAGKSLITGDFWRSALRHNLSLKSLRLLETTDCRPLINQMVEGFGYRQARLYVSKFFKPNLRSPRKIKTRVVQTGYLFWPIFGNIVNISYLHHLSDQKHTFLAASEIRLGCSGEVMITSNAYDCPADQLGKYISPGFEL